MNIFVLDLNPEEAARQHCDKHVVKMILETVQMLITTYYTLENIYDNKKLDNNKLKKIFPKFPLKDSENNIKYYKLTHVNHPCTKWVRDSLSNFNWLLKLWLALCKEYTFRYKKIHKLEKVLLWIEKNKPNNIIDKGLTEFAQAMPEIYKVEKDAVQSYRNYYIGEKHKFAKWAYTEQPNWWK